MAFPSNVSINTTNLSSSTGDPSQARADLLLMAQSMNTLIAGQNAAGGVVVLNSSGKIGVSVMPTTINSASMTFQTTDLRVTILDVLNLGPSTVADLTGFSAQTGDIAYCSNGDAGDACLAVYDGSNWKVVTLGATISAT